MDWNVERMIKSKLESVFFVLGNFPKPSVSSLGLVLFCCSCQWSAHILIFFNDPQNPGT